MKNLLVALLLFCCACFCGRPGVDRQKLVRTLDLETVVLSENGHTYCSGVWVGQDRILTAGHCVEDLGMTPEQVEDHRISQAFGLDDHWDPNPVGQPFHYETYSDNSLDENAFHIHHIRDGKVLSWDKQADLALLEALGAPDHPYAQVSRDVVQAGDLVHVVGHPYGERWTYTQGFVSTVKELEDPNGNLTLRMMTSAPIHPGNSGGGAFNADGDLVGICSFGYADASDLGFFVPQGLIISFLNQ